MANPPRRSDAERSAASEASEQPAPSADRAKHKNEYPEHLAPSGDRMKHAIKVASTGDRSIHPGLIPGIGVEDNSSTEFTTNKAVFATALACIVAVLAWAIISPDSLRDTGTNMQSWVVVNFGWLFTSLMVAAAVFMLVLGFGPTGKIRLGTDDSEPEFSTSSWIAMLFAAGLGIGLVFYGPMEPLSHFMKSPPASSAEAETMDAVLPALTEVLLHWGPLVWALYALVGGAIAYSAYRRGRLPLISAIFEPTFPDASNRVAGKIVDIFAILVTLFGTATSLGIGALQIASGTSILTGKDFSGNTFLVITVTALSVLFIYSAVSGIKKGVRMLSNANMVLVIVMMAFVLIAGPTVFILDLVPASLLSFFHDLAGMLSVRASEGADAEEFVTKWTILYWAWWISWSPFVGMFIAKISRGRTLREFVFVVTLVPAGLSALWFIIFGGTAIKQRMDGLGLEPKGAGENVMFDLLNNLPLGMITSIVCLVAILIFFTTAADSATNVMGSMSQSGRPIPSTPVTIIWGVALGLVSLFLLLAGGQNALSGLQAIMVSCSLPFALITIGIMVAWTKDLMNDPYMIRRKYARAAIMKGVHRGIDEYGDDFVFDTQRVASDQGAGADFESDDPALTEWYTEAIAEDEADEGAGGTGGA